MAKIYETKEDIERDRLSNEVRDANSEKRYEFDVGVGGMLAGFYSTFLGATQKELKDVKKTGSSGKFNLWLGIAVLAVSAANFALSLFDSRKANKAKKELDALGPQEVLLPKDVPVEAALPTIVEGKHRFRLENSRNAEPSQGAVKS